MALLDADAGPGLAIALGRLVLAERDHAGTEQGAIAREDQIPFIIQVSATPMLLQTLGHCAATDRDDESRADRNECDAQGAAKPRRAVSFSIVIMIPSAAIQTTFITPTANISSIIAQQQPRQ